MGFTELVRQTLIRGGAWQALAEGLLTTLEISFFSILAGTLLGAGICALRVSGNRFASACASVYTAVLRGSPALLLLMLMYYVVFALSDLSAPMIAVTAFSLNFSAHAAELMRSALMAADPMQAEAARTLGFSRWQAFRLITLPQAFRIARPTYQSTIVNLVQWTSVVGYVSITDLTRAVNNISSRTMQPLFMIGVGIALYLGIAYLCYGVFALCDFAARGRDGRS